MGRHVGLCCRLMLARVSTPLRRRIQTRSGTHDLLITSSTLFPLHNYSCHCHCTCCQFPLLSFPFFLFVLFYSFRRPV